MHVLTLTMYNYFSVVTAMFWAELIGKVLEIAWLSIFGLIKFCVCFAII